MTKGKTEKLKNKTKQKTKLKHYPKPTNKLKIHSSAETLKEHPGVVRDSWVACRKKLMISKQWDFQSSGK